MGTAAIPRRKRADVPAAGPTFPSNSVKTSDARAAWTSSARRSTRSSRRATADRSSAKRRRQTRASRTLRSARFNGSLRTSRA